MKLTKENIEKRLSNWKTWVALFALVGLVLQTFGLVGCEGTLGKIQEIVYTADVLLGVWSDHEVNVLGGKYRGTEQIIGMQQ